MTLGLDHKVEFKKLSDWTAKFWLGSYWKLSWENNAVSAAKCLKLWLQFETIFLYTVVHLVPWHSIMTFSIMGFLQHSAKLTLSINDTRLNNILTLCWVSLYWVSWLIYCYMLNVIILNVIMLNVGAPFISVQLSHYRVSWYVLVMSNTPFKQLKRTYI